MKDEAAIEYLTGSAWKRWGGLYEWSFAGHKLPLPMNRKIALDLACFGLGVEYRGWRAKMALCMWITRIDTRWKGYTLSRILKRGKKGRRP
jgi:hypothetical protein